MTTMQYMLLLAHASIKNETPEKKQEAASEEAWATRLKEAQDRSLERQKTKEQVVLETQKRISEMIEQQKKDK